VSFYALNDSALEYLSRGEPSEYPILLSLTYSNCQFESEKIESSAAIFAPIPWSQLTRYHEQGCWWNPYTHGDLQWIPIAQLTNVVELRASFDEPYNSAAFKLPHLRFASFAVTTQIEKIMNCLDLPALKGLNLRLKKDHSPDLLGPVPAQLKDLKILWLGSVARVSISTASLFSFLTGIPTLVDLAVTLHSIDSPADLFTLLTPPHSSVVPQLQVLRISGIELVGRTFDALLLMLRQRFGQVEGAERTRLERFEFFVSGLRRPNQPSYMIAGLESLKMERGWDIRVREQWVHEFWVQEMDGEFL